MTTIDRALVGKVLEVVDAGLTKGKGKQSAGEMCVEAAVCYALGLPHSDDPPCVSRTLRHLKINLNDADWSSNQARAKGLRRLAIAQLGTDTLDDIDFVKQLAIRTVNSFIPMVLEGGPIDPALIKACREANDLTTARNAAGAAAAAACADAAAYSADTAAGAAAVRAAGAAVRAAAGAAADAAAAGAAAGAAADAACAAVRAAIRAAAACAKSDSILSDFGEMVVQILIEMKTPGSEFLDLAPKL